MLALALGLAHAAPVPRYPVVFFAAFEPQAATARAEIRVPQTERLLEEVRLRAPAERYIDFTGDGHIERHGDRVFWRPPADGGVLRYRVRVDHRRTASSGYDARLTPRWAVVRLDDLFPPAAISQRDGSGADSRLLIEPPPGWSVVTPFGPAGDDGGWAVVNPARKFDRPTGWLAAGALGVRRDEIDGIRVAVAAPVDQGAQRVAMLALMRWTLPLIVRPMTRVPERVTIVAAGDPMWRGGLSAPGSLFLHADLPLLSEDGTSTLVHELVHVLLPVPTRPDHDWIDEGLAEYLTLAVLRDSGSISADRYEAAVRRFRKRGDRVVSMAGPAASGRVTARAVAVFHDLDQALRRATDGSVGVHELIVRLTVEAEPVDLERLRALAAQLAPEADLGALSDARLPGFAPRAD